jgi:hypothetical protein
MAARVRNLSRNTAVQEEERLMDLFENVTRLSTRLSIAAAMLATAACGDVSSPAPHNLSGDDKVVVTPPVLGRCSDFREGFKNVYFGDHHTHTSFSIDAYFFNALATPRTAHRFAKGAEPAPFPAKGGQDIFTKGREQTLDRPLDFNAVTDHAEFLGGFNTLCENSPQAQQQCDERIGQGIRDNIVAIAAGDVPFQTQLLQALVANSPTSLEAWSRTKAIVDEENEPCSYTALHGYEYTSNELGQMLHRNVIFKGSSDEVPANVIPAVLPTTASAPENGNDEWMLFDRLENECNAQIGCEAMTIAHNPNRSDGRYFLAAGEDAGMTVIGDLSGVPLGRKIDGAGAPITGPGGISIPIGSGIYNPLTVADAELRRTYDRNFEMTQHKGQSECGIGVEGSYSTDENGYDPKCNFEIDKTVCRGDGTDTGPCAAFCTGDPETDPSFCSYEAGGTAVAEICSFGGPDGTSRAASGGDSANNCIAPLDYYRNAMSEGLLIKQTLGVNPYRLNISAGLDTHNGDSGNSGENNFIGHAGVLDDDPRELLGFWHCDNMADGEDPNDLNNCSNRQFLDFARPLNPGGLAGLWVEENTRDAIWDGLHSGESFGTSGPRMRIRSVASWDPLPADICDQLASGRDLIATQVVSNGALMGGDLPPQPAGASAPYFAVYAIQDPDGNPLQQIDMIKAYVDDNGEAKNRAYLQIAATTSPVTPPSADSCAVAVDNHPATLCASWQGADFNADKDAMWYARVLEVPSCRWSDYLCNVNAENSDGNPISVDCGDLDPSNGVFPEESGQQGYEGCCAIADNNGVFSGTNRFSPIEERAWASPIWYEVNQ